MNYSNKAVPRTQRGYSLVEIMAVFAMVAIVAAVAVPMMTTAIRESRLNSAHNFVTMEIRRARQAAVDFRRIHRLSVDAQGTITLARQEMPSRDWTVLKSESLPAGIVFATPTGAPGGDSSPDGLGDDAVSFGGGNVVFFRPDGSARDQIGEIVNGIVYVSSEAHPERGKAVTLLGSTGRVKAWVLAENEDGSVEWK
ncbi:MAG TPA: prepilin-type N-terminal cleavage/methylation domain-containing protein [Acidobacteriota bacterium]|nr:prepilin-type N-terminal cleavage/methylation domain-containing protein [Acidobacteriota bacterium]